MPAPTWRPMQRASPATIVRPTGGARRRCHHRHRHHHHPRWCSAILLSVEADARRMRASGKRACVGAVGAKTGRVRDKKRLGVPLSLRDGCDNASWAWTLPMRDLHLQVWHSAAARPRRNTRPTAGEAQDACPPARNKPVGRLPARLSHLSCPAAMAI